MSEVSAAGQVLGVTSTGALSRVGETFDVPGVGRFQYTQFVNTTAIPAGSHVYSVVSTSAALAITTLANGQKAVNLTFPSQTLQVVTTGAVTANQYAGGFALVTANGGADKYSIRIKSHTGTAAAGNITLTFALGESLFNSIALVPGTDTVTLSTAPSTVSTTTATGNIDNGYTVNAIPAASATAPLFGWTQVSGYNAIVPGIINVQ